jgi:hypothetical protein
VKSMPTKLLVQAIQENELIWQSSTVGFMCYLRYLWLLAYSGVHHILCCVFVLFFFVLDIFDWQLDYYIFRSRTIIMFDVNRDRFDCRLNLLINFNFVGITWNIWCPSHIVLCFRFVFLRLGHFWLPLQCSLTFIYISYILKYIVSVPGTLLARYFKLI